MGALEVAGATKGATIGVSSCFWGSVSSGDSGFSESSKDSGFLKTSAACDFSKDSEIPKLSGAPGASAGGSYWGWNGTLTGGNTEMDTLENVKTAINEAEPAFYSWLDSIGALAKDGRGSPRGATTWPGAYDNGQ